VKAITMERKVLGKEVKIEFTAVEDL